MKHQWRYRKTGPQHPLLVIYCKTHHRYHTLYPPGYAPYLRRPLAPVSPEGNKILEPDHGSRGTDHEHLVSVFEGTYFEAALDAATGVPWPRESQGASEDRWWTTQRRRIAKATVLLGVSPEVGELQTRKLAEALGVDMLLLLEEKNKIDSHPGYRSRGQAVVRVLGELLCRESERLVPRLAQAGWVAGLWGCPRWWDPGSRTLQGQEFPPTGTQKPP